MKTIIKGKYPFEHRDVSVNEAKEMFVDQPYKIDQIDKLASGQEDEHGEAGAEPVSESVDLYPPQFHRPVPWSPPGEHGQISWNAFKLLNVAGAYWRGDENQAHAAAHLRYGLAYQKGAEGAPGMAGGG